MRPINYTLTTYLSSYTVAGSQTSTAGVPLTLDGVAGGIADPLVFDVPRGFNLLQLSDQTGQRFSIHGAGAKGQETYDVITGTASGVIATNAVFTKVYSITPEIDSGIALMTTGSPVLSPWFQVDTANSPVSIGLFAPVGSIGINASIQFTCDTLDGSPYSGSVFDLKTQLLEPLTPATPITLAAAGSDSGTTDPYPVTAVRFSQSGAITAGSLTMVINQGTRKIG